MTHLNPNKETIRRICSMMKCSHCWLLNINTENLSVLVELETNALETFKSELESWSGNEFDVYNFDTNSQRQKVFMDQGEQLLPVDKNIPLEDILKRRKIMHKKAD